MIAEDLPTRPIEYHGASFRVYLKSPADEHYFGLGDKPGPLDRRNEAFTDWNTDAFGWQESTDPIYKSIPYFMTFHKGVAAGIFLDNTWRTSFDFNKEYSATATLSVPRVARWTSTFFMDRSPKPWCRHGPGSPAQRRCRRCGRFGYQQSRYSYYPESEVRRIARQAAR